MPAVIIAAAVAVTAAACSSSSSSTPAASATSGSATGSAATSTSASAAGTSASPSASPAVTGKLTGTAATALVNKAVTNTKAAPSVVVKGAGVSAGAGQTVSFDLTLVQNKGCQGTIAQSKTQTFQLVETDGAVWLKPSAAYYASLKLSKAAQALVADKWIKVKSTDSQLGSLPKICSFNGLFGSLKTPTGASYVATPTTYQGQSAYEVRQAGQQGYAFVTNPANPMLAKLAEPGANGGVITFTEYSTPLTITPPSAAESIDGSALGI